MLTKSNSVALVVLATSIAACGGSAEPPDAGSAMDAQPIETCARDRDCDDAQFCTVDRCLPGEPGGDARGCVVLGSPCQASEMCNEAATRCDAVDCTNPDQDDDGHASIACNGDDCDDQDGDRYPGNVEVCDPDGHDEDCRPDTYAGAEGDLDGDGEVSSSCCNGDRCGTDCDDSEASINSSALEVCNGIDDDCSGVIDDETGPVPLCPGGVCTSGRCSFTAWDRVVGLGGNDLAEAVATDVAGNVYVTGFFSPGADFGAGPVENAIAASYAADGVLRWVLTRDDLASWTPVDMAYDQDENAVYLLMADTLARLDVDGAVVWHLELPSSGSHAKAIAAADGRVVVAGSLFESFDFGDGTTRTAVGTRDGYLASYSSSGTLTWVRTYGAAGAHNELADVSIDAARNVYAIAGTPQGSVDFGEGSQPFDGAEMVVFSVDALGAARWVRVFDGGGLPGSGRLTAIDVGSELAFVAGTSSELVNFGGGTVGPGGFVLALELDGAYRWERVFSPPGSESGDAHPHDVFAYDDDRVWIVGDFNGKVNFGNGALTSLDGADIFMALYRSDRVHLRDRSLGAEDTQTGQAITVGPGGAVTLAGGFSGVIDFDSGRRTTEGRSGFVARLLH